MKLLSTLFLALFALTFSVQAQATDKAFEKATEMTEKLAKTVDLNEEEKERMVRINYEIYTNGERLRNMDASAEEKQKMTEAYEKRMQAQVKELLGEERFAQYLEATATKSEKAKTRANK